MKLFASSRSYHMKPNKIDVYKNEELRPRLLPSKAPSC